METSNDYLLKLNDLIQCDTVSGSPFLNEKKSKEFQAVLENTFPHIFSKCRIINIDGSLIIELLGKRSSAPTLFISHFDTVEATGEWEHNPFSAEIENGKIFGRGVFDSKGNLFCILEALDELINEGYIPSQDFYIAISCDKESDDKSIEKIYTYFKNCNIYFSYILDEGGCVVNKPLNELNNDYALVGLGEEASAILKIVSLKQGGHASVPLKDSALVNLAQFIDDFNYNNVFHKSIHKSLHDTFFKVSRDMTGYDKFIFSHSRLCSPLVKLSLAKQPLVLPLIQSSLSFITIYGSDNINVITSEAYAIANLRISLNDSLEKCLKKIRKFARRYHLKVEVLKEDKMPRVTSDNSYQYLTIESTIKEIFNDVAVIPYITCSTTDSRVMNRLCSTCYRFVPFKVTKDQISRVHGLDENIDVDNLEKAISFYKKLIKK